jgi:hypothetical protein
LASNALSLIKELTEENKKLTINMNAYGLTAKNLGEENERLQAEITHLEGHREADIKAVKNLKAENERLRAQNVTLEQKLMLLGIDDVYVFKAKVKGETANED